jgi:hypothetical protein
MIGLGELWSAGLTVVFAISGFVIREKFSELTRLGILLNKTREEMARDMVTRAEITRIMEHIDGRFNKLEEKIDRLISAH